MVTHAATEKLTEEQVFKNGIKQIFRICTPTYQDGNAAAFVAKDLPVKTWATISPKYEYGYTCWEMFKNTLTKLKPGVSFTAESWAPFGTTDFRSHINTILDAKPEGFYSTEWAGELITIVKQANQAGLFEKIKHVMFPVGAAMDVLEGLGAEMPDNVWISGRYFFLYPEQRAQQRLGPALPQTLESLSGLRIRDRLLRHVCLQEGRRGSRVQGDERGHPGPGGHDHWTRRPANGSSAKKTTRPCTMCPGG